MTRIRCAAEQVRRGVPLSMAWDEWNFPSQATLERCLRTERGILQAAPAVQDALAGRKIKLFRALAIAEIEGWDGQTAALDGKTAKKAKPVQTYRRAAIELLLKQVSSNSKMIGLTATDLLGALVDPSYEGADVVAVAEIRRLLEETRKPGRKPLQSALPGTTAPLT